MNNRAARRTVYFSAAAAVAAGAFVVGMADARQGQPGDGNVGRAEIRELSGPEVDVSGDRQAQMVVLFPERADASQQPGGGDERLEIVLMEMELPRQEGGDARQGQQAQQQARPTGRQIVFTPDNAVEGLASHRLERGSNDRRYKVIARTQNRQTQVRQTSGGQGMTILSVMVEPTDEERERHEGQMRQYQERQQQAQQAQQAQQDNGEGGQGGQGGGEAEQAPAQPQAREAAVLIIYTGGNG